MARGQYRADQQDLGFQPGRAAKQRGEGMEYGYNGIGQGEHVWTFREKWGPASLPCSYNSSSFCAKSRKGKVNHAKERITAQDNHLFTLTDLKRISFTIAAGLGRHPNKRDVETYLQPEQQNQLQDHLVSFFDDFLPACGPEYARLGDPDQLNIELSYLRNGTYAFDALTIRLFADAWARWTIEQNQPPEQLARYVSELNLLKTSPDNDLQRTFGVINSETKRYRGVSDRSWTSASAHIREALRE